MTQYQVTVGSNSALIEISDGATFAGTIKTQGFGKGTIQGTRLGNSLSGICRLGMHEANFSAVVTGDNIVGTITTFLFGQNFSGTKVAPPEVPT